MSEASDDIDFWFNNEPYPQAYLDSTTHKDQLKTVEKCLQHPTVTLKRGEQVFLGAGDRSKAQAFDLYRSLEIALSHLSAAQQGADDDGVVAHEACKIFEGLTGISLPWRQIDAIRLTDLG